LLRLKFGQLGGLDSFLETCEAVEEGEEGLRACEHVYNYMKKKMPGGGMHDAVKITAN
jgi:hypothetical protein